MLCTWVRAGKRRRGAEETCPCSLRTSSDPWGGSFQLSFLLSSSFSEEEQLIYEAGWKIYFESLWNEEAEYFSTTLVPYVLENSLRWQFYKCTRPWQRWPGIITLQCWGENSDLVQKQKLLYGIFMKLSPQYTTNCFFNLKSKIHLKSDRLNAAKKQQRRRSDFDKIQKKVLTL